mgnify:CR=1 FL=1
MRGLRIWKEIQPGLPSCVSLTSEPVLLVLKSGSFGDAAFLAQGKGGICPDALTLKAQLEAAETKLQAAFPPAK